MNAPQEFSFSGKTFAGDNEPRYAFGFYVVAVKRLLVVTMALFFAIEPEACAMFHEFVTGREDEENSSYVSSGLSSLSCFVFPLRLSHAKCTLHIG